MGDRSLPDMPNMHQQALPCRNCSIDGEEVVLRPGDWGRRGTPWWALQLVSFVTDAGGSVRLILIGHLPDATLVIAVPPGSHARHATHQTRLNRQQTLR